MNAPAFARAGSPFSTKQIRTDRDNEYDAFARVTRRLKVADVAGRGAVACEAVHMNTQLWSALATDLALPDNALPDALKAQLLKYRDYIEGGMRRRNDDIALGYREPAIETRRSARARTEQSAQMRLPYMTWRNASSK